MSFPGEDYDEPLVAAVTKMEFAVYLCKHLDEWAIAINLISTTGQGIEIFQSQTTVNTQLKLVLLSNKHSSL